MGLQKSFFGRNTETVARALLGCKFQKENMKGRIVETEAYTGDDPACHAYPDKTERNQLLYETFGHAYIYLCYEIHSMLNFTTEKDGIGCVLVRALEPLEGVEQMRSNREVNKEKDLCNGPGKLCEALNIDRKLNGTEIGEIISVEKGDDPDYKTSTRIGISKAEDLERRFHVKGNIYVSQR